MRGLAVGFAAGVLFGTAIGVYYGSKRYRQHKAYERKWREYADKARELRYADMTREERMQHEADMAVIRNSTGAGSASRYTELQSIADELKDMRKNGYV
jgi:hypothetical protein